MKLYLAGPDLFFPDARAQAAEKKALCRRYGFDPMHPLDDPLPDAPGPEQLAHAIYAGNRARMLAADLLVAELSPFRGPSADPGTVFELGFMAALGRPVFGWSRTALPFRQRCEALPGAHRDGPLWRDADGAEIEDFGLHDNLMIDGALHLAGQRVETGGPGLAAFERCLQAARRTLS